MIGSSVYLRVVSAVLGEARRRVGEPLMAQRSDSPFAEHPGRPLIDLGHHGGECLGGVAFRATEGALHVALSTRARIPRRCGSPTSTRTRSCGSERSWLSPASMPAPRRSTSTCRPRAARCLRCRPSTECWSPVVSSSPSPTSDPRVRGSASRPQTCGKVERFHQSLKKFIAKQEPASTKKLLQGQLNRFSEYYNGVRPHRSLGRRTPLEAWNAREKVGPIGKRIEAAGYCVRHDKVDGGGSVTLRHKGKLHHIGIGCPYAGWRVILLVDGLDIRILGLDGSPLRHPTLDPSVDYQRIP